MLSAKTNNIARLNKECNMKKYINFVLGLCMLGVVDQVQGRSVHVELSTETGEIETTDLPLWIFPCDIKEGDMFYITSVDEVLEVRCGEPPD